MSKISQNLGLAIYHAKNKLIKIAKESGIYENFGQNEVRNLESKYIDSSIYSDEMNKKRQKIRSFDNWCMSYNG